MENSRKASIIFRLQAYSITVGKYRVQLDKEKLWEDYKLEYSEAY